MSPSEQLRTSEPYDILVSSAAAASGVVRDGVFRFEATTGRFRGPFGPTKEIRDPRGLRLTPDGTRVVVNNGDDRILVLDAQSGSLERALPPIQGLNPGGGKFGHDGRYYVTARTWKNIMAFDVNGESDPVVFVPGGLVTFPRGLAQSASGDWYLSSGADPVSGEGQNTILRFDAMGRLDQSFIVRDDALSPLDMEIGPNGHLFVASEFPFGDRRAITTVREYDPVSGRLVRVFDAGVDARGERVTRMPRGITFGPDGELYASGADTVVRYKVASGVLDEIVLESPDIGIQSIVFVESPADD